MTATTVPSVDTPVPTRVAARMRILADDHGGTLTAGHWDQRRPTGTLSSKTLIRRAGSWSTACDAAGIRAGRVRRKPRADAHLHRALRLMAAETAGPITQHGFEQWLTANRARLDRRRGLDRIAINQTPTGSKLSRAAWDRLVVDITDTDETVQARTRGCKWSPAEVDAVVRRARLELGDRWSKRAYTAWRSNLTNPARVPSHRILTQHGAFRPS